MVYKLKEIELRKNQERNCPHARNQICQTTREMEEKFSFLTADEVIDVWTGV